jgi:hypothetical protein
MPDARWQQTFRDRMRGFQLRRSTHPEAAALSVKVRVVSGCFHRVDSPDAYALIDRLPVPTDVEIVEHESGPELLVFLAAATAGLSLAKSVIDVIAAIIKARVEGVKKGDRRKTGIQDTLSRPGNNRALKLKGFSIFGRTPCPGWAGLMHRESLTGSFSARHQGRDSSHPHYLGRIKFPSLFGATAGATRKSASGKSANRAPFTFDTRSDPLEAVVAIS